MTFSISTKIQEIQHFSEALHVTSLVPLGSKFAQNLFCTTCNFSSTHWVQNLLKIYSADTLWVKNFIKIALSHRVRDKCVFAFSAKCQDGRQNGRENDFREKSPVHSAHTLLVKQFVEISLSCR